MTKSSVLIADTSGLFSLFSPDDHNHIVAKEAAERLGKESRDIIIPAAVYIEFLNILGRKANHSMAIAAEAELTPPFLILNEYQDYSNALKKFANLPENVSFTDCVVMAIADKYNTLDIFGFDKQFEDAGYHRLTPSTDWK
jgi:predicted nucleic acid-binding protein